MKKTTLVPLAILACAVSLSVHGAVENGGAPNLEVSIGLGAMELDTDRTGIDDTGFGVNMGVRFGADSLPLGAEWRLYGGAFSLDDAEFSEQYGGKRAVEVYLDDCEYSIVGTDFSLLVNLDRDGPVNPYFGVGFLYESTTFEADVHAGDSRYGWYPFAYHEDWDDDGVTFLLRAGLDLRLDLVYARFDASYIGEIYDEDDHGQFLLSGDLGVHVVPMVRIDVFGHYFTEYKSYYIGIGATFAL